MRPRDVSSPAPWAGLYTLNTRPAVFVPPAPGVPPMFMDAGTNMNSGVPVRVDVPMGVMDEVVGGGRSWGALPLWKRVVARVLLAAAALARRIDLRFQKAPGMGTGGVEMFRIVSGGEAKR